jgi:hypothetical protein
MTTNESLITEAHTFRATDNGAYLEIRLANALAASEAEVARVTQERDGLAAVIDEGFKAFDNLSLRGGGSGPGEPWLKVNIIVFDAALATLTAAPAATLAARDAEKKAEGWDEGAGAQWAAYYAEQQITDDAVNYPNPYRTEQQGEPE